MRIEHRRRESGSAGTVVQISHMAKEQEDAPTQMRWQHSSIEPRANHRRRSPDALAVHARGDAGQDAPCPKPTRWEKHHRASNVNPLTQRRRWADPQADHERNIEERGCQSRMSSESPEDKRTDQPQGRKTSKSSAKPTKIKRPLIGRMAFPRDMQCHSNELARVDLYRT